MRKIKLNLPSKKIFLSKPRFHALYLILRFARKNSRTVINYIKDSYVVRVNTLFLFLWKISKKTNFYDEFGMLIDISKCKNIYVLPTWAIQFDKRRGLNYAMSLEELGFTRRLNHGSILDSRDDGLYIYVLHLRWTIRSRYVHLRIRRSDRPDDCGFSIRGDQKYSYHDNPPWPHHHSQSNWKTGDRSELPHQFVRHSQLNQGRYPVLAAGQLQIRGGEILWINNESGHFAPDLGCLDCVEQYIDVIKLPRSHHKFRRDRNFHDWTEPDSIEFIE